MNAIIQALAIDPQSECNMVEDLIIQTTEKLKKSGAVVSVSGGLDSATVAILAVRSLGFERVHLLNIPEKDSNPIHREHAKLLSEHLGTQLQVKSITRTLSRLGVYKLLPLRLLPGRKLKAKLVDFGKSKLLPEKENSLLVHRFQPKANTWQAKAAAYSSAKHRLRTVVVYQYADIHNLMVIGSANRTEWMTGTFMKWGVDHCADLMPLIHLYRSQLQHIAEYIDVPDYIRNKASDPDIIPGIDNKEELLGDYETVDQILYGLENGIDKDELSRFYGKDTVEQISLLRELSRHMRESPYTIESLIQGG